MGDAHSLQRSVQRDRFRRSVHLFPPVEEESGEFGWPFDGDGVGAVGNFLVSGARSHSGECLYTSGWGVGVVGAGHEERGNADSGEGDRPVRAIAGRPDIGGEGVGALGDHPIAHLIGHGLIVTGLQ